jgi:uncharacterized protein YndB with AHSA1/START domain
MKVRVTQRYGATPERVFDAWLDPKTAGAWLFATAWRPMSRVEIDARRGGPYRLADGKGTEYTGRYIEIARPRRLVFTLSLANSPRVVTRVTAEIEPLRSGCELRLVHENVPPDRAPLTEGRWTGILYGLGETLDARGRARPVNAAS